MNKWICLRDCFVYNRFHAEGQVYELSENVVVSPKNFKLVDGQVTVEPLPVAPPIVPEKSTPKAIRENTAIIPPVSNLVCPVCGKECKTEVGLKVHMRVHKK